MIPVNLITSLQVSNSGIVIITSLRVEPLLELLPLSAVRTFWSLIGKVGQPWRRLKNKMQTCGSSFRYPDVREHMWILPAPWSVASRALSDDGNPS